MGRYEGVKDSSHLLSVYHTPIPGGHVDTILHVRVFFVEDLWLLWHHVVHCSVVFPVRYYLSTKSMYSTSNLRRAPAKHNENSLFGDKIF